MPEPITGRYGYVLTDAECREVARAAVAAYDLLESFDCEYEEHIAAYEALDAAIPPAFWHRDAAGALQGAAREQAEAAKRDEQTLEHKERDDG